ncbi:MAG: flagellar hook-associated protein FlgK [Alphaproteobacteria bacterium]
MGISSLATALSGLKINQQQIDVISNNIANVGTEGYTRKILPQSTQVVNGRSIGVVGETIVRNVDLRLERDLWTQVSASSFYSVQETYLGRVDQFHGAPDANVSVAAEVGKLQDTFSALANSPGDQFLQADVVDQAQDTAQKINDLSDYYTTLRNDAQNEAVVVVESINSLLEQISELNAQIRFSTLGGNAVASTEDARDQAINELAELIDISTFKRGDGILVVQTLEGVELASEDAATLTFRATPLSPATGYPETAAGIFVGDPLTDPTAIDITERKLGGHLGGLVELRDSTFPKLSAQLDELAHKLALRFEAQGLRLFTGPSGTIPADTPPDPTTDPPTPVEYVGFASLMQVNTQVVDDQTLVQQGTYGATIQSSSNEVIRRVIEYTFSGIDYQLMANTDAATSVDIRAGATGGTTLQDWLGLAPTNQITSGISLGNYNSIADIITAGGTDVFGTVAPPAETDTFNIVFDDPDTGTGPHVIEIDLRTVATTGNGAAADLVAHIIADPDFANAVTDFGAAVSVGTDGELVIESGGDIEIANGATDPLSTGGFNFLGLAPETSTAQDPYFDISVGNKDPVRIVIEPGDTEVELLAKLNAIEGVVAQIDADGFLSVRPGEGVSNPEYGGDINIIGGPFSTGGASLAGTAAGRTSIDDGVNIAQALFGTYEVNAGVVTETSPITNVQYQSETQNGSGTFVAFRTEFLGPGASVSAEIAATLTLEDYSQKVINQNAQELALVKERGQDEEALRSMLQQQLADQSGVNVDEELANLIVVQNAYAASARVVTAVDEIFQELLNIL